jgi:hypothetical protein
VRGKAGRSGNSEEGPSYAVVVFLEIQYKYIYTRTYDHSYVIKFSPDLLSVLNSAVRRLG